MRAPHDGRYKLMYFYDLDEWELYDLQSDPQELTNQYQNPEYAEIAKRMHGELKSLRKAYEVPENEVQSLENLDMKYHSAEIRKRGIARQKQLIEQEAKKKEN